MNRYDPTVIGYCWDDLSPRIQLEPRGERGYIEMRAVHKERGAQKWKKDMQKPLCSLPVKQLLCWDLLKKHDNGFYSLNDSLWLNDRIVLSGSQAITNSRITAEYRTTQKTKVGITPISGYNSNFSCDIKRRTWFDFVSNQVLFLVAEAGLEPTTSGLWVPVFANYNLR